MNNNQKIHELFTHEECELVVDGLKTMRSVLLEKFTNDTTEDDLKKFGSAYATLDFLTSLFMNEFSMSHFRKE